MSKKVIGLVENVILIGKKRFKTQAVCDTGAKGTSIDIKVAGKAQLGPIIRAAKVKNPSVKTSTERPVVRAIIEIAGRKFDVEVNLQDRSHMKFPVIIGRNILLGNFVVDVEKNHELWKNKKLDSELDQMKLGDF